MLWPSRKKMTAKKTTNRNCLIPSEGGFRPAGSVVFTELAIDLILTTSANLGARVVASLVPGRMGRFILKRPAPEERGGGSTDATGGAVEDTHLYSRTGAGPRNPFLTSEGGPSKLCLGGAFDFFHPHPMRGALFRAIAARPSPERLSNSCRVPHSTTFSAPIGVPRALPILQSELRPFFITFFPYPKQSWFRKFRQGFKWRLCSPAA